MLLQAENVTKEYRRLGNGTNRLIAVQPCSLTLEPGTVTVIMGRSGSGKSTLLQMLSGLLSPTQGQVLADGKALYAMKDGDLSAFRGQHFGVIPQGRSAFSSLTVAENILLPGYMAGKQPDPAAAEELMERFGILSLKNELPKSLSGGELRRMAVIRALLYRPEVLFADEPTGDLDDENTQLVLTLLKEAAANGAAVLLVTHEDAAASFADRMLRMNSGVLG